MPFTQEEPVSGRPVEQRHRGRGYVNRYIFGAAETAPARRVSVGNSKYEGQGHPVVTGAAFVARLRPGRSPRNLPVVVRPADECASSSCSSSLPAAAVVSPTLRSNHSRAPLGSGSWRPPPAANTSPPVSCPACRVLAARGSQSSPTNGCTPASERPPINLTYRCSTAGRPPGSANSRFSLAGLEPPARLARASAPKAAWSSPTPPSFLKSAGYLGFRLNITPTRSQPLTWASFLAALALDVWFLLTDHNLKNRHFWI